jgi:hypothetical protein
VHTPNENLIHNTKKYQYVLTVILVQLPVLSTALGNKREEEKEKDSELCCGCNVVIELLKTESL